MSLTPDGVRYLALARGERVPRPFHFRWLIPWICGEDGRRWVTVQVSSLVLCGVSVAWLAGWGWRGWFCASAMLGLAGVTRFNLAHPVLVDLPAMALTVCAAAAMARGQFAVAMVCVVIAGSTKETAPVFAAAYAWNPLLLLGLVAPTCRSLLTRPGCDPIPNGPAHDALTHPIRSAWNAHKSLPLAAWVLPWGVLLIGLRHPSWQLLAVLSLAIAQCAVATDTVRLYQWAWPTLAIATANVIPLGWLPVALLAHLANPFAGPGL